MVFARIIFVVVLRRLTSRNPIKQSELLLVVVISRGDIVVISD